MTASLLVGVVVGMIATLAAVMTVGTVRLARHGASKAVVASPAAAASELMLLAVALAMVTA